MVVFESSLKVIVLRVRVARWLSSEVKSWMGWPSGWCLWATLVLACGERPRGVTGSVRSGGYSSV